MNWQRKERYDLSIYYYILSIHCLFVVNYNWIDAQSACGRTYVVVLCHLNARTGSSTLNNWIPSTTTRCGNENVSQFSTRNEFSFEYEISERKCKCCEICLATKCHIDDTILPLSLLLFRFRCRRCRRHHPWTKERINSIRAFIYLRPVNELMKVDAEHVKCINDKIKCAHAMDMDIVCGCWLHCLTGACYFHRATLHTHKCRTRAFNKHRMVDLEFEVSSNYHHLRHAPPCSAMPFYASVGPGILFDFCFIYTFGRNDFNSLSANEWEKFSIFTFCPFCFVCQMQWLFSGFNFSKRDIIHFGFYSFVRFYMCGHCADGWKFPIV